MSLTEQMLSEWEQAAKEAETRAIGPKGIATLAASVPALTAEVARLRRRVATLEGRLRRVLSAVEPYACPSSREGTYGQAWSRAPGARDGEGGQP